MTDASNNELRKIESALAEDSLEEILQKLRAMQQPMEWTVPALKQRHSVLAALKRIPLFSKFGEGLTKMGDSVTDFGHADGLFNHAQSVGDSLAKGFTIGRLVFGAIDFIRIPLTYFAAWQLGQEIPMSASKNARFLYASILLGLSITALALPPLAPFIAIATATLGLGVSLFTLGRFFYHRHKLKEELKTAKEELEVKEHEFSILQERAAQIERSLAQAVESNDEQAIAELKKQAAALSPEYEAVKNETQALKHQIINFERKLEKKGAGALLDKTIGVALSSVALIGITLSLFFPPIGLGILVGAAGAGLLYLVGRVTAPLIAPLFSKMAAWFKPAVEESKTVDESADRLELSQENDMVHESTTNVMLELEANAVHEKRSPQQSPTQEFTVLDSVSLDPSQELSQKHHPVEDEEDSETEREGESEGEQVRLK
jgi:gas vesicle protein